MTVLVCVCVCEYVCVKRNRMGKDPTELGKILLYVCTRVLYIHAAGNFHQKINVQTVWQNKSCTHVTAQN